MMRRIGQGLGEWVWEGESASTPSPQGVRVLPSQYASIFITMELSEAPGLFVFLIQVVLCRCG